LAYAVLLNRRSSADEAPEDDGESAESVTEMEAGDAQDTQIVAEPVVPMPGFEEPTRLIQELSTPPPMPEPTEPVQPETVGHDPDADAQPPATVPAQADEAAVSEAPPVALARDPSSGKLTILVGPQTFGSMSELKNTEIWEQVGGLFEELHAWMSVVPPQTPPAPRTSKPGISEMTKKTQAALSMVDEINEILGEKLAASADAPQGVHIAEGSDGSIRVFIGLQGYAMDQVPDDEVRRLIREAVSEWESRS
jgi:hypothetical protein